MEPALKTPMETQGEGTNRETNDASESHAVTNTVPTGSENETMVRSRGNNDNVDTVVRSRGNHDNVDTESWMNTIIVPLTTEEIRRHAVIMITMMIASQVIYIGMMMPNMGRVSESHP